MFRILAAFIALSGLVATADSVGRMPQSTSQNVPFQFDTRQPIVAVRVNGSKAVPFVIDTGASINVIDGALARAAGIVSGDGRAMSGGGEGVVRATTATGVTLAMNALRWEDQRAAIVPLGYPDRKHYAGLIGAPILMRYVVEFDFPARVMRLIDPRTYRAPRDVVLVPFELQEDLPIVRAQVDAGNGPMEARLMLDTGAGSTAVDLNRPFVDTHHLLDAAPNAKTSVRPAGIGGSAPFVYTTAKRLTLGRLTFDAPRLGLSRATAGSSSSSGRDGIIGNVLLEQYVMTVDYERRVVAFRKTR
jgi:aspartyl protease